MKTAPELVWTNRQRAVQSKQLRLDVVRTAVQRAWPQIVEAECRGSVLNLSLIHI